MFNRILTLSKSSSCFLFGARGTGKTTLLQLIFPQESILFINLLDPEEEDFFARSPSELLHRMASVPAEVDWIVIDEIQRVPRLLDIVHEHIEFYRVIMVFWSQINQKELMKEINMKLFSHWRHEIQNIITMGMDRGIFRKEINPSMIASSIITKVLGTSLQYIFDEQAFNFGKMVDWVIDEVMAVASDN